MGQALYRKYRSKSLQEIIGQEHITDTLTKALVQGRISHAYLFSGPRGVGKTSIARILAHEINGIPYTDDSMHLDIIEIDAASNRRIDEIRELRDKVYIAPTSGKYKVYIIDEVHMLTREAFNALLKTLEEPPAHAVFILATTEAHKLPDTIISRTQHYTFKPVDQQKVIDHLRVIAVAENITIDDEALQLLAAHGEGSFRDSISLLDQARSIDTAVTAAQVRLLLGIAPQDALQALIDHLRHANSAAAILSALTDLYAQGLQAAAIASQIAYLLRSSLTGAKPLLPSRQALPLMKQLIEVPASHNPERLLEIVLLESTLYNEPTPTESSTTLSVPVSKIQQDTKLSQPSAVVPAATKIASPKPISNSGDIQLEKSAAPSPVIKAAVKEQKPEKHQLIQKPVAVEPVTTKTPKNVVALDATSWPAVLNAIKQEYNTLYGVLRMATPIFKDDGVELQFKFAFHQKRLSEVKNKQIIAEYIRRTTGSDVQVECTFIKNQSGAAVAQPGDKFAKAPALETISNIFGGGEVLDK